MLPSSRIATVNIHSSHVGRTYACGCRVGKRRKSTLIHFDTSGGTKVETQIRVFSIWINEDCLGCPVSATNIALCDCTIPAGDSSCQLHYEPIALISAVIISKYLYSFESIYIALLPHLEKARPVYYYYY